MLPVITIIGRPNVGKSTLFNVLTRTRDALVADIPGLTRDRQYGEGKVGDRPYIIVDTGGLHEPDDPAMAKFTDSQVEQAVKEADRLLFMVDAKAGLTAADEEIAKRLRPYHNKISVIVNKADSEQAEMASSEFYALGLGKPEIISATQGRGIQTMMAHILKDFPDLDVPDEQDESIRIAVVGRPNVGKSTLINRILGEERVIVFDRPGTTRDSIFIPFEHDNKKYTLIDTAGVRRRSKVTNVIEKFSIIKTMQAINQSHVVVCVINAQEKLGDQDLRLIGHVLEMGKALILAFNKWDGMDEYDRSQFKEEVDRRLSFADFARRYYISALHGSGVGKLYHAIDEAYACASQDLSTAELTKALEKAIEDHQPPLVGGRRIKLRYAHMGGHHPMIIVIHGKQIDRLPGSYKRYLANFMRKRFTLEGVPIVLRFKQDNNPYEP